MNMYDLTVPHFIRVLEQARRWLDKAQALADQKRFDVQVLLGSRLAPDMFHFTRQIQALSDLTKNSAARLAGVEWPVFEDDEVTLDEVRARIDKTVAWLKGLDRAHFQGAEGRRITLFMAPGKYLLGADYLSEFVLPNVYFHASMAYAILRANGVDLGKMDFLGNLGFHDVEG